MDRDSMSAEQLAATLSVSVIEEELAEAKSVFENALDSGADNRTLEALNIEVGRWDTAYLIATDHPMMRDHAPLAVAERNRYQTYCANCGNAVPNNQGTYCSSDCAEQGYVYGYDEY